MEALRIVYSGLIATTLMVLSFRWMGKKGWQTADWVSTVVRMLSKSKNHRQALGLSIHYTFGLIFTLLYALLVAQIPESNLFAVILVLSLLGAAHGVVAALIFSEITPSRSALSTSSDTGLGPFLSVVIAHVIFGFTLGVLLGLDFPPDSIIAQSFGTLLTVSGFLILGGLIFGMPAVFLGFNFLFWFREAHKHGGVHNRDLTEGTPIKNTLIKKDSTNRYKPKRAA